MEMIMPSVQFAASSIRAKKFSCNNMLQRTILPLCPLPLTLQNLYMTNPSNFSHNSCQYNSLFSFTILGYTGGVVHLPHPHAFAINGRAYHQEQCVQIWRVGEKNPAYINILDESYEALQYPLFFPCSEIDFEHSNRQKISQVDYYRYRIISEPRFYLLGYLFNKYLKKSYIDDETIHDEAELYPKNIYLPASHTLSYRWSYKKTMDASWGVYFMHTIKFQKHGLPHAHIIIKSSPNLFEPRNIDKIISAKLPIGNDLRQSHLRDLVKQYMMHKCTPRCIQRGGGESDEIDEIKDYINACYLSGMEAVWRIFKYKITSQLPSVTCLPVHLPENKLYYEKIKIFLPYNTTFFTCQMLNLRLLPIATVNYKYTLAQLCLLFCRPILEGENEALIWIASFLEENGSRITQYSLPELSNRVNKITRIQSRYSIILESIKSSPIWNSFEICELRRPVCDAHDLAYSKLMDNIGDGVSEENVSLKLLKTTCEMDDVIEFTFPETVLNNLNECQKRAILCLLNSEVDSVNEVILHKLKSNAIDLYSTDSIADDDITKTNQTQRNIVNVELLNSLNASGVPKHHLTLKKVVLQQSCGISHYMMAYVKIAKLSF
ncbi:22701_t:CDS:2 [Gigaspora margarita]|uniref:22701_t:CDS:1 n=1 Tax=Gigaspora margarita TaxID=4874 RepID=A0ABM8W380_GIGMA|nr:22701_t:CDS:2 [Gigaspora margarita]